ncbi:MAG: hypothetical protein PF636_02990 [Actinomycetota bacterium]|jgi:hypothetical protein|nr:hypothetical protein [Actinomycetota bacterium]
MGESRKSITRLAVAVLLVLLLLGGQAMADARTDSDGGADTTQAVGRAGFAYLTGIRTFAAASLWNRLEPQFHGYYGDIPLAEQMYMLPTIELVVMLDPEFEQAYYVAAWVLARRGDVDAGVELAQQGVDANPRAGLMRINLAEILLFMAHDEVGAVREVDVALQSEWTDALEKHQGFAIARGIYAATGETEKEAAVLEVLEVLDAELGDTLGPEAHDHDGDGVPDHE